MKKLSAYLQVTHLSYFFLIIFLFLISFACSGCAKPKSEVYVLLVKNQNKNIEDKLEECGYGAEAISIFGSSWIVAKTYSDLVQAKLDTKYIIDMKELVYIKKITVPSAALELVEDIEDIASKSELLVLIDKRRLEYEKNIDKGEGDIGFFKSMISVFYDFELDFKMSTQESIKAWLLASIGRCVIENFG